MNKKYILIISSLILIILLTLYSFIVLNTNRTSIYSIKINALNGEPLDLSQYKGKKILIVNVASKCGLTPQYKELQEIYNKYKDKVEILGVPCNQFMNQEPGSPNEIASFCKKNYGVTFQMTEKVDVKGKNQHALYKWLTQKELNGFKNSEVKWNFQKYLISENGKLIHIFMPRENPKSNDIISSIIKQ